MSPGGFRYVDVPATALTAGQSYVIGAYYLDSADNDLADGYNGNVIAYDPLITPGTGRYGINQFSGLAFPDSTAAGVRLGPNFRYAGDLDGDGIFDTLDNCKLVPNNDAGTVPNSSGVLKSQLDADHDGYGNACDGDLNNSGLVTSQDNTLLRNVLNQLYNVSPTAASADMNGSGTVTSQDNTLLRNRLNSAPGPSGRVCAGTIPCP